MAAMKLGKKPARLGAVKLRFRQYANLSRLPAIPDTFGHDLSVDPGWGVLGNDQYGDCVFAGGAHETMVWTREGQAPVSFIPANSLADYAAVTGFNADDPSTDQGTDIQQAAAYRQKVGLIDSGGVRHKIAAYLAIDPGDLEGQLAAAYLFGAIGIGIRFPAGAQDQFANQKPWDTAGDSTIEGGHYIPLVAYRAGLHIYVTWGKEQPATEQFCRAYQDEALVYLSDEVLNGGKTPEGLDIDQLQADLAALKAA